jgi:hypothetical protein
LFVLVGIIIVVIIVVHHCHQCCPQICQHKDDDGNSNNEYPVAMNELGNVMWDVEDEDSIGSSESSIK